MRNLISTKDNKLDFAGFKLFTNAFSTNSTLTHLSLEDLDDDCMIPSVLKMNSSLTSLYIAAMVGLTNERLKNICDALIVNCSLKKLGFSTMEDGVPTPQEMTREDVQTFTYALTHNSSLISLDLSGTVMKPEDESQITAVCKQKNIQLTWNNKKREVVTSAAVKYKGLDLLDGFKLPYNTLFLNGFPQSHK